MREVLGFDPLYTTAETFADFARSRGTGLLPPERVGRVVDRVAAMLDANGLDGLEDDAYAAEGAKR